MSSFSYLPSCSGTTITPRICPTVTIAGYWYPIAQYGKERLVFVTDHPEAFTLDAVIDARLSLMNEQTVMVRAVKGILEKRLPRSIVMRLLTAEEQYNGIERRAIFRLHYPRDVRPSAMVEGQRYPVAEISEGGMILEGDAAEQLTRNQPVAAIVKLAGQQVVAVEGAVQRLYHAQTTVQLVKGFPANIVFKETILVRGK